MGSSTRRTSLCPVTGSRLSTGRWLERAPGSSTWPPSSRVGVKKSARKSSRAIVPCLVKPSMPPSSTFPCSGWDGLMTGSHLRSTLAIGWPRRWLRRSGLVSSRLRAALASAIALVVYGCVPAAPSATTSPPTVGSIRHVVIIVKENHSFDNYFGSLQSPPLSLPHCTSLVAQVNCQYDGSDIPAYYAYARNFGYADTYFSDVRGPSWPNDMMMIAAQSPRSDDPTLPLS